MDDNNTRWVNEKYVSAVLPESAYYTDMRSMDAALSKRDVTHERIHPLAERSVQVRLDSLVSGRIDDTANDVSDRIMEFIRNAVSENR